MAPVAVAPVYVDTPQQAAEKILCAYERRGPGLKPALF